MKYTRFIDLIEAYYGKYERPEIRKVVLAYLNITYSEKRLDALYHALIRSHTGQYRYTPDVAIMEKAKVHIDRETDVPAFKLLEERPDDEQKAEVADMLTGLVGKLSGALSEEKTLEESEGSEDEIPGF